MHRMILVGLLGIGLTASAHAGATDYFAETVKDFGITPRGPVHRHYFPVKNTSDHTINLGAPRVSCGCVSAGVLKAQLAPGESTAVVADMDTRRIPQANVLKTVIVYVPVYGPQSAEEVQLKVQAIARDDLVIAPESLAFGTLRKGQGGTATTRLTFYSDPNWQITEAASGGAYVKTTAKQVHRQGNEVAYEVTATLDEKCPVGDWTTDVWVKTATPGMERIRIPVRVTVVAPIAVNPETVQFGEVTVGEPAEQKVILQGNRPFKVIEVKGDGGDVAVEQVAAGARPVHILKVKVTPTTAGKWSKVLEIITDNKEQPKVVVPLTALAK
ncbi:MAG TPA: DUF1573 domain-containing protein [Fimbriiglobus sp.]|nr:DUF1573 domain-containing protein [Fimbriiglobus sp.]